MGLDEHQLDQAAALEQRTRDAGIDAARRAGREPQLRDGTGRIVCKGCGEPLTPARLAAHPGACRCVECQNLHEKWGV